MKNLFFCFLVFAASVASAQNLFPVKLENCNTESFCLDCGEIKSSYDEEKFDKLLGRLNKKLNLGKIEGTLKVQVLIEANGRGCVLSHTDRSKAGITDEIVKELNKFKDWKPAYSEGKPVDRNSVNLIFTIKNGILDGKIERVDMEAFAKSFDHPKDPEIFNKNYTYSNQNLSRYQFTIWNSSNSELPNNSVNHIVADSKGNIIAISDSELIVLNKNVIKLPPPNPTIEEAKKRKYFALGVDAQDKIWLDGLSSIFSLDNNNWKAYSTDELGVDNAYGFEYNSVTGELFICSKDGLIISKSNHFEMLDKSKIKELPSNRVSFAMRDSRNRLWIGTYDGSVMIDNDGKVISFKDTNHILKDYCITSMAEDEEGNLYFGLYEFNPADRKIVNRNEGIAICSKSGSWEHFTTENSGMPFNHTTCVLYDKKEKILWISTDRAGLIRYDLNGGWENYHNLNSDIPTSYIGDMCFDSFGNLYLATRQGIVKVTSK
ncbi:two-component regulator propeller domain-containing protein [Flavobacterium sp.]|uniref:ligand-binding sensor domain-containing protein n=1 Tax=Flavobacterium sp. TaxID=239 RepID=UPI00260579AB|nr:two-component regulator propeller domain-containing protein [Flavobacterium sp.]